MTDSGERAGVTGADAGEEAEPSGTAPADTDPAARADADPTAPPDADPTAPPDADPASLADVATAAATRAGAYLHDRFENGAPSAEYSSMDVKTVADREAEARIVETIRETDGGHPIETEEAGTIPAAETGVGGSTDTVGDCRWVVDPLDGTNDFAVGLPTFGSAVTAADGDDPLATAVDVPMLGDTFVAAAGEGVRRNDTAIAASDGDAVEPSHATVAMVIGQPVLHSDDLAAVHDAISEAVEGEVKRLIHTWSPVVHWGLLAQGSLDGFVCFHPDEREQLAGSLLAREAGCVERANGPLSVFATTTRTADVLWDAASGQV